MGQVPSPQRPMDQLDHECDCSHIWMIYMLHLTKVISITCELQWQDMKYPFRTARIIRPKFISFDDHYNVPQRSVFFSGGPILRYFDVQSAEVLNVPFGRSIYASKPSILKFIIFL